MMGLQCGVASDDLLVAPSCRKQSADLPFIASHGCLDPRYRIRRPPDQDEQWHTRADDHGEK
jgi:hypothetical protein